MQKPEATEADPFGKYFNAPRRPGVEPEPNTPIENIFVQDLDSHIQMNSPTMDKHADLLKTLKSQGKYKKFLTPPPGKVFRLINLNTFQFQEMFGIPKEDMESNKIVVVDKPGILSGPTKKTQSWTNSFNKKIVDFIFRQGDANATTVLVGFIADTSQGDFYLNWQEIVRNKTLEPYTLGILAKEQEVISIGPVPYNKFFYFWQDRKAAQQKLNLKRSKETVTKTIREILDISEKIEGMIPKILEIYLADLLQSGFSQKEAGEKIDFIKKMINSKLEFGNSFLLAIKPNVAFNDTVGLHDIVASKMRYGIEEFYNVVYYVRDAIVSDKEFDRAFEKDIVQPLQKLYAYIEEQQYREKDIMRKTNPGFWSSDEVRKNAKRLVVETQELLELAKPEASENDPFGKYFDGENRDDVKPREDNTATEDEVIDALTTHVVDNSSTKFERYTELLLKLKKQGKYKPFLTPTPGRAYRLLWNVSAEKAAEILRLPINEIEADTGNAWYVSGGGVLKPVYAQVQSWSYSLSDVVVDDLLDVSSRRGVGILLVADISKNNFILNWKNLATKAKSMGDAASYLKSEKEVVSVGPVKFIEAAYINLGDGGIREKDIKLSEPLVKLWAQSGRFGEDITVASRKGEGAENVRWYFKNITRLLDSDRDYANDIMYDIGRLVKYLSDKGNQQEIANAYIAAGFGPEEAQRYKSFVKLANACNKDLMNQKAMTKPSNFVKKLYQAFNEKLAKHKKK